MHRTTNGGQSLDVISPDLTTDDKSKQGISGGLTPDNIGVEYCCVVYAFDESPVQQGVFWAGTNDGLVHVSRDGGETWTDVTEAIPELPPLGTFPPTDQAKEVHEVLRQRLRQHEGELNEILQNDLPAFNRTLQEWNAGPVIAVTP